MENNLITATRSNAIWQGMAWVRRKIGRSIHINYSKREKIWRVVKWWSQDLTENPSGISPQNLKFEIQWLGVVLFLMYVYNSLRMVSKSLIYVNLFLYFCSLLCSDCWMIADKTSLWLLLVRWLKGKGMYCHPCLLSHSPRLVDQIRLDWNAYYSKELRSKHY